MFGCGSLFVNGNAMMDGMETIFMLKNDGLHWNWRGWILTRLCPIPICKRLTSMFVTFLRKEDKDKPLLSTVNLIFNLRKYKKEQGEECHFFKKEKEICKERKKVKYFLFLFKSNPAFFLQSNQKSKPLISPDYIIHFYTVSIFPSFSMDFGFGCFVGSIHVQLSLSPMLTKVRVL